MEKKKNIKAKIIYEGKQRKKVPILTILITIIILAVLAVGYLSQWTFYLGGKETKDPVLVSINGEDILQTQLDDQWNTLPVIAKMKITKDQLLKELVQEKLLLQEAKKQNVVVSDSEVEQFIKMQLSKMGMTNDQFEKALTSQGTSVSEMKEIYRKQLTVAKLFDKTINSTINATKEEIKDYYNKNKESYHKDQQVKVKHILIAVNNKTLNESQAQERANMIVKELKANNNSNFCELVQNYSADLGSVNKCGEYTFGRGQMVPEFEDAGYNMKVGEVRIVRSQYGFHVMIKDANIPEKYLSLNDTASEKSNQTIAQGIKQKIIEGKAQNIFDSYVKKLTEKSKIIYFNPIEENLSENNANMTKITSDLNKNQEKNVKSNLTNN